MSATVHDNAAASRYEMWIEGQLCFIDYRREQTVVDLRYAKVPPDLAGRGHGATLVKGALELLRQRDERAIPSCSFVTAYIRRHPEYAALLASQR